MYIPNMPSEALSKPVHKGLFLSSSELCEQITQFKPKLESRTIVLANSKSQQHSASQ